MPNINGIDHILNLARPEDTNFIGIRTEITK